MRVVEDREPVGAEGERALEGVGETGGRLVWETVDEIEVERLEAGFAQPRDGLADERLGLDAVDGLLDVRIEILDAERGAVGAELAEGGDVVAGEAARVEFDADLGIGGEGETRAQDGAEAADFVG